MNNNDRQPQKKTPQKTQPMLLRALAVFGVFVVAAALLGMRISQLQIDEAAEWEARASNQQLANEPIEPVRGNIYDANMKLLAQSATVWTVEASPEALNQSRISSGAEKDPARVAAQEFARILELDEDTLYEKLSDKERMYYKVKGKIEKPMADDIRAMVSEYNLRGIYLTEDTKRYYPYEKMASTVLGFVGSDNNGLEGLERWYDEILAGTAGRTMVVQDAWQREITTGFESTTYPAEDGHSIRLTLDAEIQRAVEKQLDLAVSTNNARERGFCIAMDVNTGAILALAVSPSYDPNDPYSISDQKTMDLLELMPEGSDQYTQLQGEARTLQWRNKALADTYEPGSIMKIITAAAALDSGTYQPDSYFHCGGQTMVPGWDKPMSCAGDPPTVHGDITLKDALIESCNVSFINMSAGMGKTVWYDYLRGFGLTEPTGVDMPGEPGAAAIANLIYSEEKMGPVELASCSFGQSNKYTAVQMITAVCAAINGGNLMQPYIVDAELDAAGNVVKQYEPVTKRQVISPETSETLRGMLEELVSGSQNGRNAYLAGYRIGGKSGTSQKLEVMVQEEREDAFISSFIGFAPADDPQIAVLMVLDEPEDTVGNNYFGGRLVGPYVREVLKASLDIMGISPSYSTDAEKARDTITTPKVTDMDVTKAGVALNDKELRYHVIGSGSTVIGQSPAAYTDIPYNGEVTLYTDASIPQEQVTVPNLAGRSPAKARELLQGVGLNVLTTGAPDDGEGVVIISQNVEAQSTVPRGTVVTLTCEDQRKTTD